MAVKRVILQHFSMRYDYMKERPNIYQPSNIHRDINEIGKNFSKSKNASCIKTKSLHSNIQQRQSSSSRNASTILNTSVNSTTLPQETTKRTFFVHEEDEDDEEEALRAFGALDEDVEWAKPNNFHSRNYEENYNHDAIYDDNIGIREDDDDYDHMNYNDNSQYDNGNNDYDDEEEEEENVHDDFDNYENLNNDENLKNSQDKIIDTNEYEYQEQQNDDDDDVDGENDKIEKKLEKEEKEEDINDNFMVKKTINMYNQQQYACKQNQCNKIPTETLLQIKEEDDIKEEKSIKILHSISDLKEKLPEINETAQIKLKIDKENDNDEAAVDNDDDVTCPPNDLGNDKKINNDKIDGIVEDNAKLTTKDIQDHSQHTNKLNQNQQQQQENSENKKQQHMNNNSKRTAAVIRNDNNKRDENNEGGNTDEEARTDEEELISSYNERNKQKAPYENWRKQKNEIANDYKRKYRPFFGNQQRNYLGSFSHSGNQHINAIFPSYYHQQRNVGGNGGGGGGNGGSPSSDENSREEIHNWRNDCIYSPARSGRNGNGNGNERRQTAYAGYNNLMYETQQRYLTADGRHGKHQQNHRRLGSGRILNSNHRYNYVNNQYCNNDDENNIGQLGIGLSPPSESLLLQRRKRMTSNGYHQHTSDHSRRNNEGIVIGGDY